MGITGLLSLLKEETIPVSLSTFRGKTLAVDISCWIHKGSYGCAMDLALGQKTDAYVGYCLKYINMLLSYDIKPIVVFDGINLPAKNNITQLRRKRREENLAKGKEYMKTGNLGAARNAFAQSVSITSEMNQNVMEACRRKGVDCIVAPYEADAQITYFVKSGIAQAALTEDSDLLVFGCKTVLFKVDLNGNAMQIDMDRVFKMSEFEGFDEDKFRRMCILAGCDYLPEGLPNIALKKALRVFKTAMTNDITRILKRIGMYLKMSVEVPDAYVDRFIEAENTFKYSWVFDPREKRLRPLTEYPEGFDHSCFLQCGPIIPRSTAYQLALGNINTKTMDFVNSYNPDTKIAVGKNVQHDSNVLSPNSNTKLYRLSIWHPNFRPMSECGEDSDGKAERVPPLCVQTKSVNCIHPSDTKHISVPGESLLFNASSRNNRRTERKKVPEWKRLTSNPDDYCSEKTSAEAVSLIYLDQFVSAAPKSTESTSKADPKEKQSRAWALNSSNLESVLTSRENSMAAQHLKRPRSSREDSSLQSSGLSSVKKRRIETETLLRQLSECENSKESKETGVLSEYTSPAKSGTLCLDLLEDISPDKCQTHKLTEPAKRVTALLNNASQSDSSEYVPPSKRLMNKSKSTSSSTKKPATTGTYELETFFHNAVSPGSQNDPKRKSTDEKVSDNEKTNLVLLNTSVRQSYKSPLMSTALPSSNVSPEIDDDVVCLGKCPDKSAKIVACSKSPKGAKQCKLNWDVNSRTTRPTRPKIIKSKYFC